MYGAIFMKAFLLKLQAIQSLLDFPFVILSEDQCIYQKNIASILEIEQINTLVKNTDISKDILVFHTKQATYLSFLFQSNKISYHFASLFPKAFFDKQQLVGYQQDPASLGNDPEKKKVLDLIHLIYYALVPDNDPTIRTASTEAFPAPKLERERLEEPNFSDSYELEKTLINQLKTGDAVSIQRILDKFDRAGDRQIIDLKSVEQKKYILVSMITLITRASISFGVAPNTAYHYSDVFLQEIHLLNKHEQFRPLAEKMNITFQLLIQNKQKRFDSKVVNDCIDYIQQNIYEKITNADLAEYTGYNRSYLSTVFYEKTGQTIRSFIQEMKIEESKYLLQHTDMTLQDITSKLNFSNQSYFSKLFKDQSHMTPKEFRLALL